MDGFQTSHRRTTAIIPAGRCPVGRLSSRTLAGMWRAETRHWGCTRLSPDAGWEHHAPNKDLLMPQEEVTRPGGPENYAPCWTMTARL